MIRRQNGHGWEETYVCLWLYLPSKWKKWLVMPWLGATPIPSMAFAASGWAKFLPTSGFCSLKAVRQVGQEVSCSNQDLKHELTWEEIKKFFPWHRRVADQSRRYKTHVSQMVAKFVDYINKKEKQILDRNCFTSSFKGPYVY